MDPAVLMIFVIAILIAIAIALGRVGRPPGSVTADAATRRAPRRCSRGSPGAPAAAPRDS